MIDHNVIHEGIPIKPEALDVCKQDKIFLIVSNIAWHSLKFW